MEDGLRIIGTAELIKRLSDEELQERINVRSKAIDITRKDVAIMEADIEFCQAELARRNLEAFWQQNAGVAVGGGGCVRDDR